MDLNRQNMKKIIGIVAFGVLLYWGLQNLEGLHKAVAFGMGLVMPFIVGGAIAFILNVPMRAIENALFGKQKKKTGAKSWHRVVSLVLTIVAIAGVLNVVVFLIVPEFGRSFQTLQANIPGFIAKVEKGIAQLETYGPAIEQVWSQLEISWDTISETALNFFRNGVTNLLGSTVNIAASIFNGVVSFALGLVFAIYLLLQKEKLGVQFKKCLYAFVPEKAVDSILEIGQLSNRTFSNFLSGQCMEAVILGLLFFVTMTILRFPYAMMISVVIAVMALIPIVGAFIGCAVGVVVILMSNPLQALWFIVLFLVLQQVEGNLIYPKVVGNSVGLPSIWVLVAVTLGGNMMGITGILLFIPLCSVLYALLRKQVYRRLKQRKIAQHKLK